MGPTVSEYAIDRLAKLRKQVEELEQEKRLLLARIEKYKGLSITEAERVATEAERFLPSLDT